MKEQDLKGFTLIEILIASTIFALILVMATATFSMTSSYNSKISATRNAISSARDAQIKISDDVRLSNGSAKVKLSDSAIEEPVTVKDVFLITLDSSGAFTGVNFATTAVVTAAPDYGSAPNYALGVVQKSKGNIIIYRPVFDGTNYSLYRQEISGNWNGATNINIALRSNDPKINAKDVSINVKLSGYTRVENRVQQPYVNVYIQCRTTNYNSLLPAYRSQVEMRTSVESRDYNP